MAEGMSPHKVATFMAVAVLLGIVVGIFWGRAIFSKPAGEACTTGDSAVQPNANLLCPKFECAQQTRPAGYEFLSENMSSGTGNLFGGNAFVNVDVKNTYLEGARFRVSMECRTLLKEPSTVFSDTMYLKPNETATFEIEYEIEARENWQCSNFNVTADAVQACELRELQN